MRPLFLVLLLVSALQNVRCQPKCRPIMLMDYNPQCVEVGNCYVNVPNKSTLTYGECMRKEKKLPPPGKVIPGRCENAKVTHCGHNKLY